MQNLKESVVTIDENFKKLQSCLNELKKKETDMLDSNTSANDPKSMQTELEKHQIRWEKFKELLLKVQCDITTGKQLTGSFAHN